MSDCKPTKVPAYKSSLDILYHETDWILNIELDAIGSLRYLVVPRQDLVYEVGKVAQCISSPTVCSRKFIKHILRFLKCTRESTTVAKQVIMSMHFLMLSMLVMCKLEDSHWNTFLP